MRHLQIFTAKCLYSIALLSFCLHAFALDQDIQVDILTRKITTALKADKHADALPYFIQLEEMESSLKKPLPESFHFQYIKTLSLTGDKDKALNKSEAYLSKYGKKGKYYSQVLEIISPLQMEKDKQTLAQLKAEKAVALLGKIEMVKIPVGEFIMGNDNSLSESEKPAHKVTVDYNFEMGKYKVTQAQWSAVMDSNPSHNKSCGQSCPVDMVSWVDVQTFIQKLNKLTGMQYRLPTEAEWEYACRAGTGDQYTYCGSSDKHSANAWGLYDMAEKAWEWVQDGYHKNYDGAPSKASQAWDYGKMIKDDKGEPLKVTRVGLINHEVTGGLARRYQGPSTGSSKDVGFRLARTIQ